MFDLARVTEEGPGLAQPGRKVDVATIQAIVDGSGFRQDARA